MNEQRKTKHRTENIPLGQRHDLIDSTRVRGGEFGLCTEEGVTTYGSLAPVIGEEVVVRIVAYCAGIGQGCKQRVAEVEEWTAATGEDVVLFRGRHFADRSGENWPQTTYALLEPSHRTPLQTACPNHGPCQVDEGHIRREITHGRHQQQAKTGAATRKVKLTPEARATP